MVQYLIRQDWFMIMRLSLVLLKHSQQHVFDSLFNVDLTDQQ